MTQSGKKSVNEGDSTFYTCEAGSAKPDLRGVIWKVNDEDVQHDFDGYIIENKSLAGDHRGRKMESILRFTARKSMNKHRIECILENKPTESVERVLQVNCEYFIDVVSSSKLRVFINLWGYKF